MPQLRTSRAAPSVYNSCMNQHAADWNIAKLQAIRNNLEIVEHGWEQHVIIDREHDRVYRYPRHDQAAAKLQDEVSILKTLNSLQWPVAIPHLIEFDGKRAAYHYIDGEVLDTEKLASLSAKQLNHIGMQLGQFLAALHHVDPASISHSAWQQQGSLRAFYEHRVRETTDDNPWKQHAIVALERLAALREQHPINEVVVHGDLHGLNMVVARDGNSLNGVIDLSEIEYGDPHQDFRKIFMTDGRLLDPALQAYATAGGQNLSADLVKQWAYLNEWANLCHFAATPENITFQRALAHLHRWDQI